MHYLVAWNKSRNLLRTKRIFNDSCNGDARSLINNLEISLNNNKLDDKILKNYKKKFPVFLEIVTIGITLFQHYINQLERLTVMPL